MKPTQKVQNDKQMIYLVIVLSITNTPPQLQKAISGRGKKRNDMI